MKSWKWGRIAVMIAGVAIIIAVVRVKAILQTLSDSFKGIVEMDGLFYIIMGVAVFLGILHLFFAPKHGIAKEHLLYKRLGPILSSSLTCITYGVFIYCGLLLIYIVCYDENTLMKYSNLDKSTVTVTMLALMMYSLSSIGLIISDIGNPKEQRTATVIDEEERQELEKEKTVTGGNDQTS